LCEKYKSYNKAILFSALGMVICLLTMLYGGALSIFLLIIVLISMGIFSSSEILCFSAASHYTTAETSGTVLGVINTFSVIGSAGIMQLVGFLLDCKWCGGLDEDGLRQYGSSEYIFALSSVLIFVCTLSFVALFIYRQGKKLNQNEIA